MKKLSIGIIIGMILGIMIAVSVGGIKPSVGTVGASVPVPAYSHRDDGLAHVQKVTRRRSSTPSNIRVAARPRCTSHSHLAEIVEHKCVPS